MAHGQHTSRRAFLKGATVATIAGTVAVAAVASEGADAELLRLLAQADADEKAIDAYFDRRLYASPEIDKLRQRMEQNFRQAMLIPAKTPEGLKAKAKLMRSLVDTDVSGTEVHDAANWLDHVAWSLCKDLLRTVA